jgi:MFS family permease
VSPVTRLADFLALRRSIVGLLAMVVLVGTGEKLAERFLPVYVVALGGGTIAVGLLGALDNLLSAIYSIPGGYLAERLGTKRALLIFNLLAIAGFLIVILVPTWTAVLAGSALFLSWTAISLPATMGLVSDVLPTTKRTMGVSMHSLVRRVPMALGPIVGGVLIDAFGAERGVRLAFVCALAMALVAIVMQQMMIADQPGRSGASKRVHWRDVGAPWRVLGPELRNLLYSDVLIRFCEQIPYAFVVLWCIERIAHPVTASQFGLLTALEMATAMLVYIPVAYLADRGRKKPFVTVTFVFFTLFPLVLMLSQSFWPLALAFVVRGLKEFGDATRKALILDLAPDDRKAITFGVYYFVRDAVVSIAALGGAWLWAIDPRLNLLTATGFGLLGTLWFALRGTDLPARVEPVDAKTST